MICPSARKSVFPGSGMRNLELEIFFLILLMLPFMAHSDEEVTSSIVEISPGIGYYNFDEDRNIDDTAMVTIGLGLQFSRRWLMLLHYSALEYDSDRPKVTLQKYHVDVHRFFNTESDFRPYLVAGVGQMDIDDGVSDTNKNMLNAGFGLSYRMTPSWFVRADARIFASTNGDYTDDALTLSFGYRFNGGEGKR